MVPPTGATMRRLTTVLPQIVRLEIANWRREIRGLHTIIPNINEIKRARAGNKVSLFFRHIFEHKHTRKILGSNLAFLIIASSLVPSTQAFEPTEGENTVVVHSDSVPLTTQTNVRFPTKSVRITQGFTFFHSGIDLDGITGEPVTAILPGRVMQVQYSRFAYGNAILLDHGAGITSLYAHLSRIMVAEGQEVGQFTKIGEIGSTGQSSGDHLHLEIRDNGVPVNPLKILPSAL
ncbi:hypothetical protein A2801_01815 [Candidatus Woesebacteria bacterium RIFCSPHIGHO2_01_FULL_41_10]|uniref:M23ase beta-sheet core domain-containing protein n=1 Tax=Candidatus Woesebacteria bacterium RIFCSPHIGHO2_01_FULL_41_10 TaxID=1802500 RepID=A0A1F7YMS4_9BACT|nr:MAG: hypothetical protein A2801_01815 [Candidatus Woesebacteria bacterium RIFCSPHIGHO2_01_FULL_41_10]